MQVVNKEYWHHLFHGMMTGVAFSWVFELVHKTKNSASLVDFGVSADFPMVDDERI